MAALLGGAIAFALVACGGREPQKARVVALDATSGAVRWTAVTNAMFLEQPTVVGRAVAFWAQYPNSSGCGGDLREIVLDGRTGRRLERVPPRMPTYAPVLNGATFDAVFADGKDVRSLEHGRLVAYARSGRVLWRKQLAQRPFDVDPIPIVPGPGIVAAFPNAFLGSAGMSGDPSTSLVALDPGTGRILWRSPARRGELARPAFDTRTVYAFRDADHLEALDPQNGSVRWQARVTEGAIAASNLVVVSSPGLVTAFSLTGSKLWSAEVPNGSAFQAPVVSKKSVFVPIEGAMGSGCGE